MILKQSRRLTLRRRRYASLLARRSLGGVMLGLSGLAIGAIGSAVGYQTDHRQHLAQLQTPAPSQQTTGQNPAPPAEAKPGGTRPTTPAPEPARPAPEAQKEGAQPALPPAPAEKVAPPVGAK